MRSNRLGRQSLVNELQHRDDSKHVETIATRLHVATLTAISGDKGTIELQGRVIEQAVIIGEPPPVDSGVMVLLSGNLAVVLGTGRSIQDALDIPGYLYGGTLWFDNADDGTNFTKASFPGLRAIDLELQGPGGAGGGAPATTGSNLSLGNGGGAGGYLRKFLLASALAANEAMVIPAGGAGVSGAAGNAGANTTNFGSHSFVVNGGLGGQILAAGLDSATAVLLGSGGGNASGGEFNMRGGPSGFAVRMPGGSIASASPGGDSWFGRGPLMVLSANGDAAVHGAGGGGMRNGTGTMSARTGGKGGDALIVVKLYY